MNQKEQKLGVFGSLHGTLIREGVVMGRSRFKNIKRTPHKKAEMTQILLDLGVIKVEYGVSSYDQMYYTCSLKIWEEYIKNNKIQMTKWLRDAGDCDNFAFLFAALASWILRVNTCTVAVGPIFKRNTENQTGRHCFNVLLTEDDGIIKPILFEPITDLKTVWKPPKTELGPWGYKIDWCSIF